MSNIQAYDIKARRQASMKNPQPYLMKNGTWALKGTSSETGITMFKIVGKTRPVLSHSRIDAVRNVFFGRHCDCGKLC